jgi:hypothetical protein
MKATCLLLCPGEITSREARAWSIGRGGVIERQAGVAGTSSGGTILRPYEEDAGVTLPASARGPQSRSEEAPVTCNRGGDIVLRQW